MRRYQFLVIAVLVVSCPYQIFAAQNKLEQPLPENLECKRIDQSLEQIREKKQPKQIECEDENLTEQEREKLKQELAALEEIERKLEEERLKFLFVDMNSVMEAIGSGMDWTANMVDSYFADDDAGKESG